MCERGDKRTCAAAITLGNNDYGYQNWVGRNERFVFHLNACLRQNVLGLSFDGNMLFVTTQEQRNCFAEQLTIRTATGSKRNAPRGRTGKNLSLSGCGRAATKREETPFGKNYYTPRKRAL
jgi:hypothetical protein